MIEYVASGVESWTESAIIEKKREIICICILNYKRICVHRVGVVCYTKIDNNKE